jgi:hypothetical protein
MIYAVYVACLLGQAHLVKDEGASETIFRYHVEHQTAAQNKIRDYILTLTPLGSPPLIGFSRPFVTCCTNPPATRKVTSTIT